MAKKNHYNQQRVWKRRTVYGERSGKKLGTVFLQYLFFFWKVKYDTKEEWLLDGRRIG